MRQPTNQHILSRMNDKKYNVLDLPCGWFIVDLTSGVAGYVLDLTSDYSMALMTNAVLYQAELIDDEGHQVQGLTMVPTMDPSAIPMMLTPDAVFLSKLKHMAWDHTGECIHWGPAPFREIDKQNEDRLQAKLRDRRRRLVSRAAAIGLVPHTGAQKYGDAHPKGTYTMDLNFERAKLFESHFKMTIFNAPSHYKLVDIQLESDSDGMSIVDNNDSDTGFITITRFRGDYVMMVGPERVQEVVEFIEQHPDWAA